MKKYFLLAAVIAAVDQALKAMICFYPEGRVIWSVPPLFELYRTTNTGAAFSMMSSKTVVVAVISSVLMLGAKQVELPTVLRFAVRIAWRRNR